MTWGNPTPWSLIFMTLAAIEAAAIIWLVVPREWFRWPRF